METNANVEFTIHDEVEQKAKRKKKRAIILMILAIVIVIAVLFFRNLLVERAPVSEATFRTVMEANGYTLIEATYQVDYQNLEIILLALNETHQIEFWLFNSASSAQNAFATTRNTIERERGDSYRSSHLSVSNFNTFQMTTNGEYLQLLRIDNMFIFGFGQRDATSQIRDIIYLLQE